MKPGRHRPNPAGGRHAPQLSQWKPGVAVFGAGVHPVIGDMGDAQIGIARRVARLDPVKFGRGIVGRAGTLVAFARLVG